MFPIQDTNQRTDRVTWPECFFLLSQEKHTSTISLSYSCRGLYCRIKAEKKSGKHHCYSIWTETKHNSSWHTPDSLFSPVLLTEHNQDWFDIFRISEKLNCETESIKGLLNLKKFRKGWNKRKNMSQEWKAIKIQLSAAVNKHLLNL